MITDPSAFRGSPPWPEEEEEKQEPEEKTPEMMAQERKERILTWLTALLIGIIITGLSMYLLLYFNK